MNKMCFIVLSNYIGNTIAKFDGLYIVQRLNVQWFCYDNKTLFLSRIVIIARYSINNSIIDWMNVRQP